MGRVGAQEQLLTCLILRAYLKTTYRGVIEVLEVSDALRERLGLQALPHYSTLKKFALIAEGKLPQATDVLGGEPQ